MPSCDEIPSCFAELNRCTIHNQPPRPTYYCPSVDWFECSNSVRRDISACNMCHASDEAVLMQLSCGCVASRECPCIPGRRYTRGNLRKSKETAGIFYARRRRRQRQRYPKTGTVLTHQVPLPTPVHSGIFKCSSATFQAEWRLAGGEVVIKGKPRHQRRDKPRCRHGVQLDSFSAPGPI